MTWPVIDTLPASAKELVRLLLDAVVAISFALVLLSARNGSVAGPRRAHQTLAGFSYTVYVVHFPVLILLGAAAHDLMGVTLAAMPQPANVALGAVFVAVLSVFAWAFAAVTEHHTPAVRDALMRLTPRLRSSGQ